MVVVSQLYSFKERVFSVFLLFMANLPLYLSYRVFDVDKIFLENRNRTVERGQCPSHLSEPLARQKGRKVAQSRP